MRLLRHVSRRFAFQAGGVRRRALLRMTAQDGAISYEQPATPHEASKALLRYPDALVHVVIVEELEYRADAKRHFRIWRTLAETQLVTTWS